MIYPKDKVKIKTNKKDKHIIYTVDEIRTIAGERCALLVNHRGVYPVSALEKIEPKTEYKGRVK